MESRILTEAEMAAVEGKLPEGTLVTYIKLVGIGPNTVQNHNVDELRNMIGQSAGFFLITPVEGLGDTLLSVVQRFIDQRTKNEQS